jgi:hypothetical protein
MRRGILLGVGVLETALACVLFCVGWMLPRTDSVEQGFARVGEVTRSAETEVKAVRGQVDELRRKDFPKIAAQMKTQSRTVGANVKAQTIDFATVEAMRNALAAVAKGLAGWSETLDAEKYLPAIRGLGATADLLDAGSPPALRTADALESTAGRLEHDLRRALVLLRLPIDVAGGIELLHSAERSAAELGEAGRALRDESLAALRNTLRELDESLSGMVTQAEGFSATVLPVVVPDGRGPPTVELRPVWPDGPATVARLKRMRDFVRAAERRLDDAARAAALLPPMSEQARRQLADAAGEFCPPGAEDEDAAERVAESANTVPALLRGAARLRELAAGLRSAQQGLEQTFRAWPELVETLRRSATVLDGSRRQLDTVLTGREQYDKAVTSSLTLAGTTEDMLEIYTTKLDARLGEQERSLGQMERGLGEVNQALPAVSHTASDLLRTVRWVFWLIGLLIAAHGVFVAVDARMRR